MCIRWPLRIVLPLCGLVLASLWLGPPQSRWSPPTPAPILDPSDATDNDSSGMTRSPSSPTDWHYYLGADTTPTSVPNDRTSDQQLVNAENVGDVLELLPPTCGWHHEPPSVVQQVVHWQAHAQDRSAQPMRQRNTQPRQQNTAFSTHTPTPATETAATANRTASNSRDANTEDPHLEIFSRTEFPSALECAECHQQIFEEWAISQHAYAAISPMFHKFEQKLNELSQGTSGYFCLRCHAPVAVAMELRRDQAIWDGPRVFREGVTCVACHRVAEQYGKTNGERRIERGDLSQPIYGAGHGAGVDYAIEHANTFKVKPNIDPSQTGQTIHRKAIPFEQLSRSDYCVSCHQVAVDPGIKLEVVWDQYAGSPACKEGISCQDCHMGRVPGVPEGYAVGPSAIVNEQAINPARKHSNHVFFGPGSSIAHPGIYPHNKDADRWTVNEWLQFNWRDGWGTDEFEDALESGEVWASFPPAWDNVDDRYDAREVLDQNLKSLDYKNELRRQVMENGSRVNGPFFDNEPRRNKDLHLHYEVCNTNKGHNLPSGSLGAQPQVWLNVVLIGPDGRRCWESGYLDTQGDLADRHSQDVLSGRVPLDRQLFNLQTKFLTTNVKGTDREMFLPINVDFDQLPFLRPGAQPISVMNHPPFIRMEGHSLPPLGKRDANYIIPGERLTQPGVYRLAVRMRSRVEPIYFMKFVGATQEMQRAMIETICDSHEYSVQFEIR